MWSFLLVTSLLGGCGEKRTPENLADIFAGDRFRRFLDEKRVEIEGGELPSLSIGVAVADEMVVRSSWGWADREKHVGASPTTVYPVGSVSKSFTAVGIMVLAERGDIDLDASANRYLTTSPIRSLTGNADGVTVRHLLQMTGGVPHVWWHNWKDRDSRSPDMPVFLGRYGLSVFPPGREFLYSNLSYGALEQIIANVSGRPYEEFMIQDVFIPLGMTSTGVHFPADSGTPLAAQYDPEIDGPLKYDFLFPAGAGGFRSSIEDLLRFGISMLGHDPPGGRRILSARSLDEMLRASTPSRRYGLGFFIGENDGGWTEVKSNGSLWGAAATLRILPEPGLVAAAITNTAGNRATDAVTDAIISFMPAADRDHSAAHEAALSDTPGDDFPDLQGTWQGKLMAPGDIALPLRIVIDESLVVEISGVSARALEEHSFRNGLLSGAWSIDIELPDVDERPVDFSLFLRKDAETLTGYLRTYSENYSLPFAAQLTRISR